MLVILVVGTLSHYRFSSRLVGAILCGLLFFVALGATAVGQTDGPVVTPRTAHQTALPTHVLANVRVGASDQTSIGDGVVESSAISMIRSIEFVPMTLDNQSVSFRQPRVPSMRSTVTWVSPRAVHRTLYFNDNPLERYGRTNSSALQPALSVLRFGTDTITAPGRYLQSRCNGRLHYATSPR